MASVPPPNSVAPPGAAPAPKPLGASSRPRTVARKPVPANADSTRSDHFRRLVTSRTAIFALVIGVAVAFVGGAALGQPLVALLAPLVTGLGVLGVAFYVADRHAEQEFFQAWADSSGLTYSRRGALPELTPLLGAGDRRRHEHVMSGAPGGVPLTMCHYTYEIRTETRDEHGHTHSEYEPFRFTVVVSEVPQALTQFRGVFLRRRRGLFERLGRLVGGDRWQSKVHNRRDVRTESSAFNERYELSVVDDQHDVELRELLSPSFVIWLAEHPLAPGFEFRAGTLTVFVEGHLEEGGKLTFLLDAAREIHARVVREVAEEQRAGRPARPV